MANGIRTATLDQGYTYDHDGGGYWRFSGRARQRLADGEPVLQTQRRHLPIGTTVAGFDQLAGFFDLALDGGAVGAAGNAKPTARPATDVPYRIVCEQCGCFNSVAIDATTSQG